MDHIEGYRYALTLLGRADCSFVGALQDAAALCYGDIPPMNGLYWTGGIANQIVACR
jgi:hypothetical protein